MIITSHNKASCLEWLLFATFSIIVDELELSADKQIKKHELGFIALMIRQQSRKETQKCKGIQSVFPLTHHTGKVMQRVW